MGEWVQEKEEGIDGVFVPGKPDSRIGNGPFPGSDLGGQKIREKTKNQEILEGFAGGGPLGEKKACSEC